MRDIKYHYAKNENGDIVDISDVNEEYRRCHRFFCISCGEEMVAKIGKIKARHFAHKVDTENCNNETYLHKLTKLRLKEKFDSNESFEVAYWINRRCSNINSCVFSKDSVCEKRELKIYDLKQYYDICEVESKEDKFIGDLKISSSKNKNLPPVLIEVCVTHECTLEKKESGIKIIEVYIKDEEDIINLLSNRIAEDKDYDSDIYLKSKKDKDKCRFYGFKRDIDSFVLDVRTDDISRFVLYESGLSHLSKNLYCSEYTCKVYPNSILEINIDGNYNVGTSLYKIGNVISLSLGYNVKTCSLCKYRKENYDDSNFCCLYKKFNTPKNPESKYAKECKYYKVDNDVVNEIRQQYIPDITFKIVE